MFDVICVGSAVIDNLLTIHQKLKSITYGSKVLVRHFETHTGGGGSNSAVALSKLGLKVAYLGKLGEDNHAHIIEKELKLNKIKILNKNKSQINTDEAFILNSEQEKDRIIYIYKGSSEDLNTKDILEKLNAKWFYLAALVGRSFKVLLKLSKYAKKHKIKILFNPSTYLAGKGLRKLKPILKNTNLLILNKEEAQLVLKSKSKSTNYLLKKLSKYTKGTIIITNGPKTLYSLQGGAVYSSTPPKIKVIHTAGAGDAFNSGVLAGMIKNHPLEKAIQLGQANSASVIQHFGTKNKLLTEREAKKLIKKYKIKVIKKQQT
jgi:ribokinase